jgi:long-chain acyl-CoA synthetase
MYFKAGERWTPITWGQFGSASRRLAALLIDEGVAAGEHVGIWSGNRPQWHIADAAILSVRARPVPVYISVSAEQAGYVLGHSESRALFVENRALLEQVLSVRDQLPALRRIVVIDPGNDETFTDPLTISWTEALRRGETALASNTTELDARIAAVDGDDIATLIYTSGTTGPPKAVKLTHRNVAAAAAGGASFVPGDENDRVLSYLPLAHIAERMNSEFRQYIYGNATWFSTSIDKLGQHLVEVRPTLFFAVPRIWEKMAAQVQRAVASADGARGRMVRWAVATGGRAFEVEERGGTPWIALRARAALADRLVLHRLRGLLGLDHAKIVASGAAPIAPDVLRFFAAIGLPILEVYGQTENTGAATANRPGHIRIGTVGQAYPDLELKLAEDGEILTRGDVVFAGYHKDDAATAEALQDGWLLTGDIGELDADGYLRITDRKKDLIITAGGKNISPSNIETALKRHVLVSNAVAIGDRRPYVSALLALDPQELAAFARRSGLATGDLAALSRDPTVLAEVKRHVEEVNSGLSHVEQVKRWTVLEDDFVVGQELTPTLKVKRKVVAELHAAAIESNYTAT